MAIEINGDKSLRRCVCKVPNGYEVEKIKVRYGNIEKLVWTKDPLRVYRQKINAVTINNVYVKSEFSGTYCGDDEYRYSVEGTPYFTILTGEAGNKVKITSIKLAGYIDISVDQYYILRQTTTTLEKTSVGSNESIVLSPTVKTRSYFYSTSDAYIECYLKAEITYADGYVHTYIKKETFLDLGENYVLDSNIPALKN